MEPNNNELLRSKILEADKMPMEWNQEKVLAGLNIASKPKKSRPSIFYYSAAASILFACFVLYNSNSPQMYQARTNKPIINKATEVTIPSNTANIPSETMVAENNIIPLQTKRIKHIKSTPVSKELTIQIVAVEPITTLALVGDNALEIAPEKKKIAPIIGIDYNNHTAQEKRKKLPLQIEFGKQNNAQNLAYQENNHFLQTTLN